MFIKTSRKNFYLSIMPGCDTSKITCVNHTFAKNNQTNLKRSSKMKNAKMYQWDMERNWKIHRRDRWDQKYITQQDYHLSWQITELKGETSIYLKRTAYCNIHGLCATNSSTNIDVSLMQHSFMTSWPTSRTSWCQLRASCLPFSWTGFQASSRLKQFLTSFHYPTHAFSSKSGYNFIFSFLFFFFFSFIP